MFKLAKGIEPKYSITKIIYFKKILETNPKNVARKEEMKAKDPVIKIRNIVKGIKIKIKEFTKTETTDNMPVLYTMRGRTAIVAETLVVIDSLNPNLAEIKLK